MGEEASGRAGGCVRQAKRHPAELPLAMGAIAIWARMEDELGGDVGYRRCGGIRLTRTPREHTHFQQICQRENRMGLATQMVSEKDAREIVPALSQKWRFTGGHYCATDGTANPLLAAKTICRAARCKGVRIREHEPVTGMRVASGRVASVSTAHGRYQGGVVVNAAGPWARNLCNMIGRDFPLVVYRDHLVITETMPAHIEPFISFEGMYLRQALEGNVHLWGGCHPIRNFDKRVSWGAFGYAAAGVAQVLPHLRMVHAIRGFAGLIAMTPDELPILDRAPGLDNFYLAAGFSGHGFCLGPMVGRLFAEWIVDDRPSLDLDAFRYTRSMEPTTGYGV